MRILILAAYTVRELILKATLLVLAGISTLILLVVLAGVSGTRGPEGTTFSMFGQQPSPPLDDQSLATLVRGIEGSLSSGLFAGVILFGVLATAGILPETLEKGTADLYLSKPLSRAEVLAGRALGAALVMGLNIVYFLLGLWLVIGLRVGVWDARFLAAPPGMTFGFLCLYAVVAVLGISWRNTAIAIIGAFLYQFVVVHLLQDRQMVLYPMTDSEAVRRLFDGLYYLFPQTSAVQHAVQEFIAGAALDWKPLLTALATSAGWYLLGWWVMERADY